MTFHTTIAHDETARFTGPVAVEIVAESGRSLGIAHQDTPGAFLFITGHAGFDYIVTEA